jgi:DNA-binding transcriptional MerR regulator
VHEVEETALKRIEAEHPEGLTSRQILDFFQIHQVSLSEATLRKYVQLGLLPRSIRIGQKGKHRGSKGLYPARVVRQIVEIKRLMARDLTIEQIKKAFLFPRGELSDLEQSLSGVFATLGCAAKEQAPFLARGLSKEVSAAEGISKDLMSRLRALEARLHSARQSPQSHLEETGLQGVAG